MKTTLLIPLLLAVGCAHTKQYTVTVDSDPPGARVFLSMGAMPRKVDKKHPAPEESARDYLGSTPCTATITGDKKGHFLLPEIAYASKYVGGVAVFTAEPPASGTNLYTQILKFRGHSD